MMDDPSIVEYFAEHEGYRCGYCKSEDTNYSHGMWAHSMTVEDYQDLIDRGWRRSGKYVYKPTMNQTCCPQYTIRMRATDYKPTKSQKKVIKQVHKYLNYDIKPHPSAIGKDDTSSGNQESNYKESKLGGVSLKTKTSSTSKNSGDSKAKDFTGVTSADVTKSKDGEAAGSESSNKPVKQGVGADPNKPPRKKAKLLRKEKWLQKQAKRQEAGLPPKEKSKAPEAKSIEELLDTIIENPAHRLEVKLVRSSPKTRRFEETFEESYQVYKSYQMRIHKDPAADCDKKCYTRFLVDSPLEKTDRPGGFEEGFGSFHQQYILDGKIIAVGVVDVMPHCLSSVYLYYDPDYSFLSLGTYSAVREVAFTRYLHSKEPSIEYYYMGFYIHTCPKMIYKGNYEPSFLLCPESYDWVKIERCRPLLEQNRYCRFAGQDKRDGDSVDGIGDILVLHRRQAMPYSMYRLLNSEADDEDEVKQYAGFVGKTCAKRMLLYRK